jgi:hypothetical protein
MSGETDFRLKIELFGETFAAMKDAARDALLEIIAARSPLSLTMLGAQVGSAYAYNIAASYSPAVRIAALRREADELERSLS